MVSIVTMLPTGWSVVRIPVGERDFSVFQNFQTGSGAHPAFYLIGTGLLPWDYSSCGMKLTTDILLVLRLECSLHNRGSENFNCLPCIKFLTSLTSTLSYNFTLYTYEYFDPDNCLLKGRNMSVLINRLLEMHYTQCAYWFNL